MGVGGIASDVVIIGGGPAGSVAGFVLAKAGWRVTILEQHRFPRHKVCGEMLSSLGIKTLSRLGLDNAALAAGPADIRRVGIHADDGREAVLSLAQPMWGLSRYVLDEVLLREACAAGAACVQPARCEGLFADQEQIGARARSLRDNSVILMTARLVVVADGKGFVLGRRFRSTGDFGLKAHFVNVESARDVVALFGVRGHYAGLGPIENDRWNLAMSVPAHRLKKTSSHDALFREVLRENPQLRRRMASARRVGAWLAAPLPRFAVAGQWPDRMIPVGNAAAALEPIGGEGMGLAIHSAELAAQEIDRALRGDRPVRTHELRRQYQRLWQRRRVACRAIAMALSSPGWGRMLVRAAGVLRGAVYPPRGLR